MSHPSRLVRATLGAAVVLALAARPAFAASLSEIRIHAPDVSPDPIPALRIDWKVETTPATGEPPRVQQLGPVRITREIDQASPRLHAATCRGDVLRIVRIDFFKAAGGGRHDPFLTATLENATISSLSIGGGVGEPSSPVEQLSLDYTKITWDYKPGSEPVPGSPKSVGWDVAASTCMAE